METVLKLQAARGQNKSMQPLSFLISVPCQLLNGVRMNLRTDSCFICLRGDRAALSLTRAGRDYQEAQPQIVVYTLGFVEIFHRLYV